MDDNSKPAEDGFEYAGEFYRWHISDGAKDLMLIDRFTKMPVHEFFELIEDNFDRGRAPILLAMIATSVRNGHPDWSVERVQRTVENLNLGDVTFVDADAEEEVLPPTQEGSEPSVPASSGSESDASSSTSSETTPERSRTSSVIPA